MSLNTTPERWGTGRNLLLGGRFLFRLPDYLRHPLSLDEAHTQLGERLSRRDANFLMMLTRGVFENPGNPLRQLFRAAGIDAPQVEQTVRKEGVEDALKQFLQAGIYVTVDEFKGRAEIRRGSLTLESGPDRFRNPHSAYHLPASSGGSRSGGTPVLFDLEFVRSCAADAMLVFAARKGLSWRTAVWEVPGGGSRFRLLKYAAAGLPPERWFSQIDPRAPGLHPLYAWSSRMMRWGSLLAGVPMPRPIHTPVDDPQPVLQWIRGLRRAGQDGHLFTFPSSAVALAEAALRDGSGLDSLHLTISGEPVTGTRVQTISRAGAASVQTRYGSVETGAIGYGCLNPTAADDVHLLSDLHALIQAGEDNPAGLPPRGLLITALHPRAPFVLVNASMGDEAELASRACGCPLQHLGWDVHLQSIRSFEKLTGAGMTFAASDIIRVLEEVLPARFGGSPGDFQLVEHETAGGRPELRLLVSPRLGPVDADEVRRCFLESLGAMSAVHRLMELAWREADLVRIERRLPYQTRSGKVQHLHLLRG